MARPQRMFVSDVRCMGTAGTPLGGCITFVDCATVELLVCPSMPQIHFTLTESSSNHKCFGALFTCFVLHCLLYLAGFLGTTEHKASEGPALLKLANSQN